MDPAMAQNRLRLSEGAAGEDAPERGPGGGTVSLRAEVPEQLLRAMRQFIECHPNWDQYRLVQAALAGFLVQNGVQNRGVTRCYLANLFPGSGGFDPLPESPERSGLTPMPRRDAEAEGFWASDRRGGCGRQAA
jgi:hypothetical protein